MIIKLVSEASRTTFMDYCLRAYRPVNMWLKKLQEWPLKALFSVTVIVYLKVNLLNDINMRRKYHTDVTNDLL